MPRLGGPSNVQVPDRSHGPHPRGLRDTRAGRFAAGAGFWLLMTVLAMMPMQLKAEPGNFHLAAYSGKAAKGRLLEIVTQFHTGYVDSYLAALAPGYVHARTGPVRWEVEAQVVRHWGEQHHWELNGLYIARWTSFPWEDHLSTSVALGGGVSRASQIPRIEPRAKEFNGGEESARVLGYLMLEIEMAPPGDSQWSGFFRLHHRSGASGVFSDVRGGSNFKTLGIRRYF